MGPYQGGQAQYIRIPFADFNALKLPAGTEVGHLPLLGLSSQTDEAAQLVQNEADFALLADIFPTGWHGVVLSGFKSGESIAIFGAGPVGLMAAYSANLRGASKVYVVDAVPERLSMAKKIGCIPIDFTKSDPVEQIISQHGGMVDRAVDAVGYQAFDSSGSKEKPNVVLDNIINVTRPTGGLGIIGLYVPKDDAGPDSMAQKGQLLLSFGKLFEKGLHLGTGQCNVKAYNRYLRDLIISGKAKPSFVVSHECGIDEVCGFWCPFFLFRQHSLLLVWPVWLTGCDLMTGRRGVRQVRPQGRRIHQGSSTPQRTSFVDGVSRPDYCRGFSLFHISIAPEMQCHDVSDERRFLSYISSASATGLARTILTCSTGLSPASVLTSPIRCTTRRPLLTLPKIVCLPSSQGLAHQISPSIPHTHILMQEGRGRGARGEEEETHVGASVMKNWLPLVSGPLFAMLSTPAPVCLSAALISSAKRPPHMEAPPRPVPVGSPPCTMKLTMTRWMGVSS